MKNDDQVRKKKKIAVKGSKWSQVVKSAGELLSKVRDFYIRSLTDCSNHMEYGMALSGPAGQVPAHLPRNFSVGSTTSSTHGSGGEDFSELLRAASTRRSLSQKAIAVQLDFQMEAARKSPMVARSRSVGIGRIEEEKTYELEEDFTTSNNMDAYPRSRSTYAVHRRRSRV